MKNLHLFDKEIDFESVKNSLELPWVSLVEEINKVFYMYTYKPNPSVYYKIEDNTLYYILGVLSKKAIVKECFTLM